MEVCFDILVPRKVVESAPALQEICSTWGGEKFSQDPKRYGLEGSVSFTERALPRHIERHIPSHFGVSAWQCLSLDGGALSLWERVINSKEADDGHVPLKDFLNEFLRPLENWAVVFELNCDQIDHIYEMNCEDLIKKIDEILCWKNQPEGFIALRG